MELILSSCEKLRTIPELPPILETLDVKCCYSLQTIPELPPSLKTLVVGSCKSLQTLPKLPHFFETLDAEGCESLQTLPELPPCLKTLYVPGCILLQTLPKLPSVLEELQIHTCLNLLTLPELPPSLEILNARDCKSLKSVFLFPSAVEQLKENRRHVLFWNCMNLDQHSLEAIALNALINLMKYANQHLSSPNHDDVENYIDYENNYYCYQVVYIYPGSSVPEWFEYRTNEWLEDYKSIDISSAPPLAGFIFCFVLGKYRHKSFERIEAYINISDDDGYGYGYGKKDSFRMYIDHWHVEMESDHVCVVYDQRCSAFLNSRVKNQTRFKIEVTIMSLPSYLESFSLPQAVLKGFGVSPISTSAYNSFIQQMELRDSKYQFH